MSDFGFAGGCCPSCCRAADYGSHDFCLPCDTSPWCSKPYEYRDFEAEADTPRVKTPVPDEKPKVEDNEIPKANKTTTADGTSKNDKADNDNAGNDNKDKMATK
ncbi:hypothetical protein HIM_00095 [Hirsutella minnesotensis 3608]|nr:hypothetical protein HIM_00095 [Hirsutella minnesotensis 3608]